MQTISVVGSTGSIGTQTIDVVRANRERFRVVALAAGSSVKELAAQARELEPEVVALADRAGEAELRSLVPSGVEVRSGAEALESVGAVGDIVVNAVVGFAGLPVTMAALRTGRRLALANKESLIAAGPLVQEARSTPGAELLPVDSEHSAIHQSLRSGGDVGYGEHPEVARLVLTASGGPFRGRSLEDLHDVTVEQALRHPTWSMGPKITVDSSTLFNKGLEVIEAQALFGVGYDRIQVVVHPQSIVHSAVEYTDGSTIAQLSHPDMRLPIEYALGYPERMTTPYGRLDWTTLGSLQFEAPDLSVFRCLSLAYQAGRTGGTAPAWLNAANEVAVDAFLNRQVTWLDISSIIEETLSQHDGAAPTSIEVVEEADRTARARARRAVEERVSR